LSSLSGAKGEHSENKKINHGTNRKHGKKKENSVIDPSSVVCYFYLVRRVNIARIRKLTTEQTENTERRRKI